MKLGTLVAISDINDSKSKFEELRKNGFTSCQLVHKPDKYDMANAEIIQSAADECGIEISAFFCGYKDRETVWDIYYGYKTAGINIEAYRAQRIAYIKEAAEFASHLKTEDVIIHAGFVPNDPFSAEYALMVTGVYTLARHCKNLGLNLLLETGGEAPITMLRLIEDVGFDNLYINFDPANILMYGYGNPVDALYVLGKYVRNIHGKDGMLPTDTRKLGKETAVGEGMVDFPAVFKLLKELNYDRYITIEREISGSQQTEDILKAKKYFESLL